MRLGSAERPQRRVLSTTVARHQFGPRPAQARFSACWTLWRLCKLPRLAMPARVRKAAPAEGIAPIYFRILERLFWPSFLDRHAVHLVDGRYEAELPPISIA